MTIKERTDIQFVISRIKRFIKDFQDQGVQINMATYLEWLDDIERLIRYKK